VLSVATVFVLLAGIVAAAVGKDGDQKADVGDVDLVSLASERLDELSSYRMEMRAEVAGQKTVMRMDFASQTLGRMTVDVLGHKFEIFVDDQRLYAPAALGSDRWIRFESTEELGAEEIVGVVGNETLGYLKALAGDDGIDTVGVEKVRGVDATRYRVETTIAQLLEQTPQKLRDPEIEAAVAQLPTSITLEVWVSADGLLRRMTTRYELEGFSALVELELFDFGAPIAIDLPAPESVVETRTSATFVELRRAFGAHLSTLVQG
jgi:hypothetical protein